MIVYLVRHAAPKEPFYSGFPGPPLGEHGQLQAQRIGAFLQKKQVDLVFSSDYIRTLQSLAHYQQLTQKKVHIAKELRERENLIETHDSLVYRVQNWFENFLNSHSENMVIFSHCGPINMILSYLDPDQTLMDYPYSCEFLCLTPKAGIWELELEDARLLSGRLVLACC